MPEAKYTVKMLFAPRSEGEQPEKFLRNFVSMAELQEWAEFNNNLLGIPQVHTAYFSVEHADGSPLSDDELQRVNNFANREKYAEREREDSEIPQPTSAIQI